MESIKEYLDNIFCKYPDTDDVLQMKKEMYEVMKDKYLHLMENGKNEDEAIGIVIKEFGDIKDIHKYLNGNKRKMEKANSIEWDLVEKYLRQKRKGGIIVAVGVVFIIFAYIAVSFIDFIGLWKNANSSLGDIVFYVILMLGVITIISGAYVISLVKSLEKEKVLCSEEVRGKLLSAYAHFRKKYFRNIIITFGLYCISPVSIVLIKNNSLAMVVLLGIISIATYLFINTGNENESYKKMIALTKEK